MSTNTHETRCPVCDAPNSLHATVCVSCGGYIQNRVPTLDLFATAWGVIEHPVRTFRTIAKAEHKNYAFFLFALGGILPTMWCFHLFRIGEFFPSLLTTLPLGVIAGLILGTMSAPLAAITASLLSALVGGDASFRNGLGSVSYALVPVILVGILTLPIQWLTFGEYQFTLNPHPETINATSYWALNIIQWVSIIWTGSLLLVGIRTSMRLDWVKTALPWAGVLMVLAGSWYLVFAVLRSALLASGVYYVY